MAEVRVGASLRAHGRDALEEPRRGRQKPQR